jgi:hypothetical protein
MQSIPLSQGKVAIVDDEDFPLVSQFKWCFRADTDRTGGYALRHIKIDGKATKMYLHRQLMEPKKGKEVIFLNHDKLDCWHENLLVVSHEEARQHHRIRRDSRSGIKGVRYNPETDTWSAIVYRQGHQHLLGTYSTMEAAKSVYEAALKKENPELHEAPMTVRWASIPESNSTPRIGASNLIQRIVHPVAASANLATTG